MTLNDLLTSAFSSLSGDDFEEIPVPIETFVTDYLHHPPLSDHQYDIVRASTQIFRHDTLVSLYGHQLADEIYAWTKTEVICALGKGSGKDAMAVISVLYIVYQLLCLKNPQTYFGVPQYDSIDLMNIAINADQAQRVFFDRVVSLLKSSEWFDGKYDARRNDVGFDKNVNLISGHSESESLEGHNVIAVILDEISGFAMESNTGNAKAKTGPSIYKMHRGSVTSRFPQYGKVILLSFPREENDFIMQRYRAVIAESETVKKVVTLKRDPDLPDGTTGNEFDVEWEEDHILRYNRPKTFALKRPSWEINPLRNIEDYTEDFYEDMGDALTRFAAMPTTSKEDAFIKNQDKINEAFVLTNGVDEEGVFFRGFKPKKGVQYFMHVDLAQKHDRCAVALAHVADWRKVSIGAIDHEEVYPVVQIDAVRWWQPTKTQSVDFKDVIDYILAVRRLGFELELVTFDRWNSWDTRNTLEDNGINTDNLSVGNDHYTDFKTLLYDGRVVGPDIAELKQEMYDLKWLKNKVDHPRTGFKDLSDASCGATYNAIKYTMIPENTIVEVKTLQDIKKEIREEDSERMQELRNRNVIVPPTRSIPRDLVSFIED